MKIQKSRAFRIEIYKETDSYDVEAVRNWIHSHYDYVFILHDKDVFEEDIERGDYVRHKGELKDPHFHYVIRWNGSPRYSSGLSKELGVDERFILPCYGNNDTRTCLNAALAYLIHKDDLEKYQYDISEVVGNSSGRLYNLFLEVCRKHIVYSDGEIIQLICEFIRNQKYISSDEFICYCAVHGWEKVANKYGRYITRVLDEHNYNFNYKNYY